MGALLSSGAAAPEALGASQLQQANTATLLKLVRRLHPLTWLLLALDARLSVAGHPLRSVVQCAIYRGAADVQATFSSPSWRSSSRHLRTTWSAAAGWEAASSFSAPHTS